MSAYFESRCLWLPKDEGHLREYEDAFHVNAMAGRAAVADGVSSAIFSREWARLLTCGIVDDPPQPNESEAFDAWLGELRKQWFGSVDFSALPWNQKAKLQQSGGGSATLLWIELADSPIRHDLEPAASDRIAEGEAAQTDECSDKGSTGDSILAAVSTESPNGEQRADEARIESPAEEDVETNSETNEAPSLAASHLSAVSAEPRQYQLRGFAVGDCCLFHCRNDEVLSIFPIQSEEEFGLHPVVLRSTGRGKVEFHMLESSCQEGDLIVLATDAIAHWLYRQIEDERLINWAEFWELSFDEWNQRINRLREDGQMRYDDTTLMLLRIGSFAENQMDVVGPLGATEPDEAPADDEGDFNGGSSTSAETELAAGEDGRTVAELEAPIDHADRETQAQHDEQPCIEENDVPDPKAIETSDMDGEIQPAGPCDTEVSDSGKLLDEPYMQSGRESDPNSVGLTPDGDVESNGDNETTFTSGQQPSKGEGGILDRFLSRFLPSRSDQ